MTKDIENSADNPMLNIIARAFDSGALPGEKIGLDKDKYHDAAQFVLEAMQQRNGSSPAIAIAQTGDKGQKIMRVAVINDNMPFLVDSIAASLTTLGIAVERVLHPVLAVRRDSDGILTEIIEGDAEGETRESVIYMETERTTAKQRKQLKTTLESCLSDVFHAVHDWPHMQMAMREDADRISGGEEAALLRWFIEGNLTQLAHFTYRRDGEVENPLGMMRNSDHILLGDMSWEKAFEWFESGKSAPLVIKSNVISSVHRCVPLDMFVLPIWEDRKLSALSVHAGIWTSAALAAFPQKVPVLRASLKILMDKFQFDPSGHAGKALVHAMTALPHDLLMGLSLEDLERVVLASMSLADRPRAQLMTVRSALDRHLFAFVWLPRDEISTGRRKRIENMLNEAANAPTLSWSITLEDGEVALLRYTLDLRETDQQVDDDELSARVKALVRGWDAAIEEAMSENNDDPAQIASLVSSYADAFPQAYRDSYGAMEAAEDVCRIDGMAGANARDARLYKRHKDKPNHLRLKLYSLKGAIALSDAVPVLENFGFDVLEEVPTPLAGGEKGYIHDFLLALKGVDATDNVLERAAVIETAIAETLLGRAENDVFNRLITDTGLSQQAVIWLRAWFRYLRQTGLSYGIDTVVDALHDAPDITRALIALFDARHNPNFKGDREAETKAQQKAIRDNLTHVSAIDDDRLLRLFRSLVMAILRTNSFAPAGQVALAFKIESAKVPGLPAPLPWREIFVYSPRVEGIHLRSGPVARGGLRWSDRRDDFRTEILGLMKAQRVKNAVIVPSGAKGGFFAKQLPDPSQDRDAWLTEGKESYKVFIRTLLSITDNIVDNVVIHPESVVIHDGEDPYFVVAADKGTATFSDTANGLALEKNFWLGDAFASGGSHGYDHKAMGITAKGAWVSVQRHFLEMGVDVQNDPVRVAGCGDMSGDVFGNGMLLSKAIKLVAAFDHRHIFLDPDPDPAKSWAERKRLFDLPRSSWDDYEKGLISKGGGVFARSLKTIPLTPEVQEMLGLEDKEIEPNALISAILRAQVDLLWFGGIGTYIKAAAENNVQVFDPGNDPLRVDAEDLRCKVVGEGANLGVTQAARIAYSLCGGRINADFIDNSAGVDCSDNEVNIKIGLGAVMKAGKLKEDARNTLLVEMTDNVSDIVLNDNRLQALGLSIAEQGGARAIPSYVRLIEQFEDRGQLDRKVEGLADNDMLQRRAQENKGLTRPELAVLLSTAKLALQDAIERQPLHQDPVMLPELRAAFPEQMRDKYGDILDDHQLRKEIIATKIANRIVNRMGLIHPFELADEEGCSLGEVAVAFIAAEKLFNMAPLWQEIDQAQLDETVRLDLFERTANLMRVHIADILRAIPDGAMPGDIIGTLQDNITKLKTHADSLLNKQAASQSSSEREALTALGVSDDLAAKIVMLSKLDGAAGLASLAEQIKCSAEELTSAFSTLGEAMGIDWAQMTAVRLSPSDPWERLLASGLSRDFQQMRLDFLRRTQKCNPQALVDEWVGKNPERIKRFRHLVEQAQLSVQPSTSMLAQIASQARALLTR